MFGKKKYYDDYEEESDDDSVAGSLIPPQQLGVVDYVLAVALGILSFVMVYTLSYNGLHPDAWSDCAIAAGLRPAQTVFPGFWRLIARGIYNAFGIGGGGAMVSFLGKVVLGVVVALAYLTFKEILAILVRTIDLRALWGNKISRCVAALSAFVLLGADPVWTLGYAFTPTLLNVLLFSLSVFLLARFLGSGRVAPAYWAMFVMGLFCAESPMGLVLLFGFWMVFYVLLTKGGLFHVQLLEPLMQQSSKWFLTFFWAIGFLAGIAVNVLGFIAMDGLEATDLTLGALPLAYVVQMWHTLVSAATAGAWIIGIGVAFLPFVLGIAMLRRATDLEYFLSYHVGIVFFVIGCIAYSQVAALQPLWFWELSDSIRVGSRLLLFVCAYMSAGTILCALTVVAVDAYCRDHRRLAAQINPDLDETSVRSGSMAIRNATFAFVAVLIVAGILPGRVQTKTNRMLALFDDYVREILDEAQDAKWLFTDGAYDCALELESARRGGDITCVSLLPGPSVRSGYSLKSKMPDDEDKLSADAGGSNVLRTWQRDKPERMEHCAMQLGLELWRVRSGREYPPVSGVLARTKWQSEEAVKEGIERGYQLIERVLGFYKDGGPAKIAGRMVNDLFLFMQWRLARLARVRSEISDRDGDVSRAMDEMRIADALDDKNESLKRILDGMARLREHTMRQMTPREGLHFALVRADFLLARRYAEPILDADPDDADANFGMGMSYLVQEQYGRAEEYLMKCLKRNAKEPAVWNNIAVIQMRLGRYDDAMKNAKKALELLPDSAEIKDTMKQIEKEAAEAAKNVSTNAQPAAAAAEGAAK